MTRYIPALILGVMLVAPPTAGAQALANPELIGQLAKQLGASHQQAMGAAGALFGLARTKLQAAEFSRISAVVPGMSQMLDAAPKAAPPATPTGTTGLAQAGAAALGGPAGGLASVAGAFNKLGLKPEQVAAAASVVTSYVSKVGGPALGNLFSGALK
jgi:hypothetical protein